MDRTHWVVLPAIGEPTVDPVPTKTLDTLQVHVGGMVEVVNLELMVDTPDLWVHEEGAFTDRPINHRATALAEMFAPNTLLMPEGIRGGAVIAGSNADGETVGLRDAQIESLLVLLEAIRVTKEEADE